MTHPHPRTGGRAYVELNPGEYGFVHQVLVDFRTELRSAGAPCFDVLEAIRVLENARARVVGMPPSWAQREAVRHG